MKKLILTFLALSSLCHSITFAATFEQWKKSYAKEAAKRGIPSSFTLKVLKDVKLDQTVIEKDRNQVILSKTKDYNEFMKRWLRDDNERIKRAKLEYERNLPLLEKVEKRFGVDKEVIISLWGVETYFGEIMGDYDVITSLATLVYDGRRRRFYTTQLNAALRLLYKGHVKRDSFKGSWAGATGQCQFMPSNIPAYGYDFNKDGKIDIWNSKEDIFASIANFLKKAGWKKGLSIGQLVVNEQGYDGKLSRYRSAKEYQSLGFKELDGSKITGENWRARKGSKIPLKNSPYILMGSNYKPLLNWNNSSLFAAFNILITDELQQN